MLTPDLAQRYLESCEIACSAVSSGWTAMAPAAQGMSILWSRRKARCRSVR
jgi:hypothetical protein